MKKEIFIFSFCIAVFFQFPILSWANKGTEHNKPYSIVILGDSITEGYGLKKELAYPRLLEELFKKQFSRPVQILNAGISGSTSSTAIQRLKWFLKNKPDMLIIALGANDGLRGVPVSTLEKNLKGTIELAQENKIKVVLAGMLLPPNYGQAYRTEFENVFKKLSRLPGVTFVPFLLKDVAGDKKRNQEDGIHPNEEGQKIIAQNLYPLISELVPKDSSHNLKKSEK